MSPACDVCGDQQATEVFEDLEAASPGQLSLCTACLARRQSAVWPAGDPRTERLRAALDARTGAAEHYAYLGNPTHGVHLVRLHAAWRAHHRQ